MSSFAGLKWLLVLSLALPIVHVLLAGVETVLNALGDETGGLVVGYVALVVACLWLIALVGLVICSALMHLPSSDRDEP